jgi:hypothetical protein
MSDRTFMVGGPSLFARMDPADARRVSTRERIAGYKARCKALGLAHDEYGIPIVASVRRRRPVTAHAAVFDQAVRRAVTAPSTAILNRAATREPVVLPIDPSAERSPVYDPAASAQLEQVDSLELPSSCLSCPKRRTFSDGRHGLSWGYCTRGDDGGQVCSGVTRRCPSCKENKPMEGWGLGFVAVTPIATKAEWCCPSCKFDVAHELPLRFAVALQLTDIAKHLLVSELSMQPGLAVGQICVPLARLVGALRESTSIDIDLSDCDQSQRDATATVLSNVSSRIGQLGRDAAQRLYVSWVESMWVAKDEPRIPRALTEFERSALIHGEQPHGGTLTTPTPTTTGPLTGHGTAGN